MNVLCNTFRPLERLHQAKVKRLLMELYDKKGRFLTKFVTTISKSIGDLMQNKIITT